MAETAHLPAPDAGAACRIADDYLANEVGNLLMAVDPQLVGHNTWRMSIQLGNAVRGLLGEVGTISVNAETGEVDFDEEERTRVKSNARRLTRGSAL